LNEVILAHTLRGLNPAEPLRKRKSEVCKRLAPMALLQGRRKSRFALYFPVCSQRRELEGKKQRRRGGS